MLTIARLTDRLRAPLQKVQRQQLAHLPFELRLLTLQNAAAVLRLRNSVLADLPDPDWYVRETDEPAFVRKHLGGHSGSRGQTLGLYKGRQLIAYAMLGLPRADDADNLGIPLGLDESARARVAHLASCMVRTAYRGYRLQRPLLAARMALAQAYGRSIFTAMVSLRNQPSRRNMMHEGLHVAWVGEIQGLRRQILCGDILQPWVVDQSRIQVVSSLDFERQQQLTRAGWCGVGFLVNQSPDALLFAPRVQTHDCAPVSPT